MDMHRVKEDLCDDAGVVTVDVVLQLRYLERNCDQWLQHILIKEKCYGYAGKLCKCIMAHLSIGKVLGGVRDVAVNVETNGGPTTYVHNYYVCISKSPQFA